MIDTLEGMFGQYRSIGKVPRLGTSTGLARRAFRTERPQSRAPENAVDVSAHRASPDPRHHWHRRWPHDRSFFAWQGRAIVCFPHGDANAGFGNLAARFRGGADAGGKCAGVRTRDCASLPDIHVALRPRQRARQLADAARADSKFIREKIGGDAPLGTVFKSRVAGRMQDELAFHGGGPRPHPHPLAGWDRSAQPATPSGGTSTFTARTTKNSSANPPATAACGWQTADIIEVYELVTRVGTEVQHQQRIEARRFPSLKIVADYRCQPSASWPKVCTNCDQRENGGEHQTNYEIHQILVPVGLDGGSLERPQCLRGEDLGWLLGRFRLHHHHQDQQVIALGIAGVAALPPRCCRGPSLTLIQSDRFP